MSQEITKQNMVTVSEERMSAEFLKIHLLWLPFPAVIHHFTNPDVGSPHDHPFAFTSFILSGGYVEQFFKVNANGSWTTKLIYRQPGTTHMIEATHIHQIVELPEGDCYTLIIPQQKTHESRFWKSDESGAQSRAWFEGDF